MTALMELPVFAIQGVTLSWSSSPNTNVAGYKIYYGVASRTYTNAVPVGNVTNTTVTGLLDGTTYYFAATTYDASGNESGFSNEAIYTPSTIATNQSPTNSTSANPPSVPPTLNVLNNLVVNENAGMQTVNLSGISSGATNQILPLTVLVASSNPALIPTPTVNYTSPSTTGTLNFMPVTGASGVAVISVTVNNNEPTNHLVRKMFSVYVNAVQQPPALAATLTSAKTSGSQFSFNVTGVTGYQYAVQVSSDLVNWTTVQTNTAPFVFTDPNASQFSQRYYRTFYLPPQ